MFKNYKINLINEGNYNTDVNFKIKKQNYYADYFLEENQNTETSEFDADTNNIIKNNTKDIINLNKNCSKYYNVTRFFL